MHKPFVMSHARITASRGIQHEQVANSRTEHGGLLLSNLWKPVERRTGAD